MADEWSGDLLARWRAGDQQAATEMFHRYANRLISLARSRLSPRLSHRVDPEDVVQSAYRSFFADTRDGRYVFERGGDLWRLLVTITLHKLQRHVKRNNQQKRAVDREQHFASEDSLLGIQSYLAAHEPSPAEAVALTDQMQQVMEGLEPLNRQMLQLRLQGYTLEEIADQTRRSLRTVCRVLERVKLELERSLAGASELP